MTASLDIQADGDSARPISVASLGPILRLAAPLTAFFAIQSAASLASVAMLGRVGDVALAGVGAAGTIYGVLLALMFGADAAVQATVSRRVGGGRSDLLGQILADALAVTVPLGLALAAALWLAAPNLLAAISPGPGAAAVGSAWLRATAPSLVFLSVTIPINACWIGAGRPGVAFAVTALLAPLQIGATFVLVFGFGPAPALGAPGAGWAISAACFAGLGLQLALATRPGALAGFGRRAPRSDGAAAIAAIGWPISAQQAFVQLGFIVAYVIVARLGVATVAATNVLINLATVPAQLAVGLGVAAATLVGQTLGRDAAAEARRWGWRAAALGLVASLPFVLVAVVATRPLLGLFLHVPTTLALAIWPTRVVGIGVAAVTLSQVLCFALRGAGATRIGAAVPFVALWLLQLPLTWWIAVTLGFGLLGMATVQTGVAVAEAAVTALVWSGAAWTTHKTLSKPPSA
jgi:putative MATE family efflux protein